MPTLSKLTPELKEALGKINDLINRYDGILEKSKSKTLRDTPEATNYIDDVIKRYILIKGTSPSTSVLQEKKESYLNLLKQHGAEISIVAFSKPGDLASRLKELDFEPSKIDELTKGLEQAGGDDDLIAVLLSSFLVTSETMLTCASSNNHHHGHPVATVSSYGSGGHHHGHW